ncbi:YheC/YheD family protein [Paenibacillus sp. P25]|nr:YheC/YheD family protein [Paenibacillus sp. P25]
MAKNKGYIGIMVANRGQRKGILQRYLRSKTSNVRLYCFTPSSVDWKSKTITGLHRSGHTWKQRRFPFPEVVYNKCYTPDRKWMRGFKRELGKDKCFNHITQFDKLEIYGVLSGTELRRYLPDTVAYDQERVTGLLEAYPVLYLKPCKGWQGKGVYRVELKESGEIHIGHHHFKPELIAPNVSAFLEAMHQRIGEKPYIIQRGIEAQQVNGHNFDIRVLVQKNKKGFWTVTNTVSRIAHAHYFNTGICEKVVLSEKSAAFPVSRRTGTHSDSIAV